MRERWPGYPPPMIEAKDLSVRYGEQLALKSVSASFTSSSMTAIVGPNGAGKSTLMRCLIGLQKPDAGSVRVEGRMAWVAQRQSVEWDVPATVSDLVMTGRMTLRTGLLWRPRPEDRAVVQSTLEELGIADLARRPIGQLSGGQQQRAVVARALAQEAENLVLDEPFVGVDAPTEDTILHVLAKQASSGKTVLVVHHDLRRVEESFHECLLLRQTLIAHGPTREVLSPASIAEAYGGRPHVT